MRRVEFLRREIARERSAAHKLGIVVAGVALAAILRLVVDQGRLGFPFVTFAPVVLLTAILLRWGMAALTALLSLAAILVLFHRMPATSGGNLTTMAGATAITSIVLIYIGDLLHIALFEIDRQRQKFQAFNTELQHRGMNALQIIQVLISQAAASDDMKESFKTLSGRVSAMAAANKLLGPGQVQTCDLRELINAAIKPFPHQRFRLFGPQCRITGKSGVRLIMALHELSTNAIKYGALSGDDGSVSLGWRLRGEDIELDWREDGGPPVLQPTHRGMGSTILSPNEGLAEVELLFNPEGVECRLVAKADLEIYAGPAPFKPSGKREKPAKAG